MWTVDKPFECTACQEDMLNREESLITTWVMFHLLRNICYKTIIQDTGVNLRARVRMRVRGVSALAIACSIYCWTINTNGAIVGNIKLVIFLRLSTDLC
jgi:hypothetical protein